LKKRSEEANLKCETCNKAYKNKMYLIKHTETVHQGQKRKEKKYKCDDCDMTFRQKEYFDGHLRKAHNTDDNFKCKVCRKVFYDKGPML
jgi:uncharacterized C2H2 Zn-finger protein